jgi:uncharacterized protein YecE (DUF72 family)
MLKLRNVETPLANFFANGALALGPKLGPILWQLPPTLRFDARKLEGFFKLLPGDTAAASELGREHDHRLKDRVYLDIDRKRPLRHAIEIRHDSFRVPEFITLLRRYNIALVCADTVEWPLTLDVTADFVYCRLHGSKKLYTSGYGDKALQDWAYLADAWSRGGDPRHNYPARAEHLSSRPPPRRSSRNVFVFFDNDAKVRAPFDAQRLKSLIQRRRQSAAADEPEHGR